MGLVWQVLMGLHKFPRVSQASQVCHVLGALCQLDCSLLRRIPQPLPSSWETCQLKLTLQNPA